MYVHYLVLSVSTLHVCKRLLFSRTKLVMTDHRKLMDPSTLETLIMLRMNKELWMILSGLFVTLGSLIVMMMVTRQLVSGTLMMKITMMTMLTP